MLVHKLAAISSISLVEIDLSKPTSPFGIDSLVAVELRSIFWNRAGSEASTFEILQAASLRHLVKDIESKSCLISFS